MPVAEKKSLMCPSGSPVGSGEPANTEQSFTSGPWRFDPRHLSHALVDCADGAQIGRLAASIFHEIDDARPMIRVGAPNDSPQEVAANARLISAAPDMFEALREIEFIFDGQEDIDNNGGPNDAMKALTAVRAALSKARGA